MIIYRKNKDNEVCCRVTIDQIRKLCKHHGLDFELFYYMIKEGETAIIGSYRYCKA